jgi:hypothetical protein
MLLTSRSSPTAVPFAGRKLDDSVLPVDDSEQRDDLFFTIDHKPLVEFDAFIDELKGFVNKFYVAKPSKPISVVEKLTNWSNLSARTAIQKSNASLLRKVDFFDNRLREMIDVTLLDISSLSAQARHLTVRLKSCIQYNEGELAELGRQMNELQELAHQLTTTEKNCKEALHFLNEVTTQLENQSDKADSSSDSSNNSNSPSPPSPVDAFQKNLASFARTSTSPERINLAKRIQKIRFVSGFK